MLCEGSSMRAISRVTDVSINTVTKLLIDAGLACARFHDEAVRGVKSKRVQCDEIWSVVLLRQGEERSGRESSPGASWRRVDMDGAR